MKTADAVIIGGGVIGASIAYHLALKGLKNIIVVDKGSAGSGSTGKATGGFRAQFGSEINIKLSLLSREKLLTFKDETGIDPLFNRHGYLFLAQSQDELLRLKQANELQRSCGLDEAEIVSIEAIQKLNPRINLNGIIGGAFCGSDGFISPVEILKGYTKAAESLGVKFLYSTEITNITVKEGRAISVTTPAETIAADYFINAAGAWAGKVAELAGIDIPLKPLKRQVCRVTPKNILPDNLPMTVWVSESFHFRMRDGYLILLRPCEPENTEDFNMEVEESWLEKTFNIGLGRIPALKNCSVDKANSWAGLYEMSPDEHILLGSASGLNNFYLANGSSGHGVMHSPAIGQLMAELIMDKNTSIDITRLSPNRFNQGKPISSIEFF
jgi:sarcosine oxidase, subunit beta